MNKGKVVAAIIVLSTLISGCSASASTKTPKDTSCNKGSVLNTEKNAKANSNDKIQTSAKDYSKYTGYWGDKVSLKMDRESGTSVNIKVDKDGNLSGTVCSITASKSHIASVDIKGKIENNQFIYNFKEDGWYHKGTINIKFEDKNIILNIKYSSDSKKLSSWGISEGTFILINYNTNITSTLKDIKDGGLRDIKSFSVNLKNYGNVKFIGGLRPEDGKHVAKFYLLDNNNKVLYRFPDFYGNSKGEFLSIKNIEFVDIDKDGAKDIVIIAQYSIFSNEKVRYETCTIKDIYFSKGKEFVNDKNADYKVNSSLSD